MTRRMQKHTKHPQVMPLVPQSTQWSLATHSTLVTRNMTHWKTNTWCHIRDWLRNTCLISGIELNGGKSQGWDARVMPTPRATGEFWRTRMRVCTINEDPSRMCGGLSLTHTYSHERTQKWIHNMWYKRGTVASHATHLSTWWPFSRSSFLVFHPGFQWRLEKGVKDG